MASFVLKDVRIFDGENTIEKGFVLVESGKISKVSSSNIQFDGQSFSKPGHTVLPGLIDVHIHADKANPAALPQSLRFGVTTVCDM
jgi:imidazolonepropionase-like amidohydrolase